MIRKSLFLSCPDVTSLLHPSHEMLEAMSCFTTRWCCTLRMHKLRLLSVAQILLVGIYSVEGGVKWAAKQDIAG